MQKASGRDFAEGSLPYREISCRISPFPLCFLQQHCPCQLLCSTAGLRGRMVPAKNPHGKQGLHARAISQTKQFSNQLEIQHSVPLWGLGWNFLSQWKKKKGVVPLGSHLVKLNSSASAIIMAGNHSGFTGAVLAAKTSFGFEQLGAQSSGPTLPSCGQAIRKASSAVSKAFAFCWSSHSALHRRRAAREEVSSGPGEAQFCSGCAAHCRGRCGVRTELNRHSAHWGGASLLPCKVCSVP